MCKYCEFAQKVDIPGNNLDYVEYRPLLRKDVSIGDNDISYENEVGIEHEPDGFYLTLTSELKGYILFKKTALKISFCPVCGTKLEDHN